MSKFIGNIILKGKMICKTGLHIGGSKDKLEIGGVDSPVIRDPYTKFPYIPGSSLKGKMRSLLSFAHEIAHNDPPKKVNEGDFRSNHVIRVFGVAADQSKEGTGPTRLIVRDAHPDKKTIDMWQNLDTELLYTEYKPENNINRLTSAANPRFMERIAKDSSFNVEFVFGIYRINESFGKDEEYFKDFIESLKLLESSYLGGSGSRGYGQVEFKLYEPFALTQEDYRISSDAFKESTKSIDILLGNDEEKWKHLRLSDFDENKIKDIVKVYEGK